MPRRQQRMGRDMFVMTVSRPFFYARSMEFIGLFGHELRQHML